MTSSIFASGADDPVPFYLCNTPHR